MLAFRDAEDHFHLGVVLLNSVFTYPIAR